jgi:hypothetical protein
MISVSSETEGSEDLSGVCKEKNQLRWGVIKDGHTLLEARWLESFDCVGPDMAILPFMWVVRVRGLGHTFTPATLAERYLIQAPSYLRGQQVPFIGEVLWSVLTLWLSFSIWRNSRIPSLRYEPLPVFLWLGRGHGGGWRGQMRLRGCSKVEREARFVSSAHRRADYVS